MENVLSPLIPTMTSNTTPSGKASCSSVWTSSYYAYFAFDGIAQANPDRFWEADGRTSQWLMYEFPKEVKPYVLGIDITSHYLGAERYTDTYYLQSSSDGVNWENILDINPTSDELINYTYYKIEKTVTSKYFRWYFPLGNVQGTFRYTHVTMAQLYG